MHVLREHARFLGILAGILILAGTATYLVVARPFAPDTTSQRALALKPDSAHAYASLSGDAVDLSKYEGKVIVVNAWATWSPFSKGELTDLDRLAATYGSRGVVVLAIDRKETTATMQAYLRQVGDLPNLIVLADPTDTFYAKIGGFAMPETIIYASDGSVTTHVRGTMTYDQMAAAVEEALSHYKK